MNNRWLPSLLWAIVALILLLPLLHPIQVLTMSFMAVPFVMLYVTQTKQNFVLVTITILAATYFLKGNVIIAVYFIIPAVIIGQLFKSRNPALNIFMVGTITFLAESLLLFIIAKWARDFNVYEYVRETLNYKVVGVEQLALLASKMVPFIMIISALYMGTITYAISRRLIVAQGYKVQGLKPVRDWMLPKSLVLYYVVVSVLDFVEKKTTDSLLTTILLNVKPFLQLALILQGLSFFLFYAHIKNWGKISLVIIIIAALFLPPFHPYLSIIGFLDLIFPVRKFLSKPKA